MARPPRRRCTEVDVLDRRWSLIVAAALLVPGCSCGAAASVPLDGSVDDAVSGDAGVDGNPLSLCEGSPSSALLIGRVDGVPVSDCLAGALGLGEVDENPSPPGVARERILMRGACSIADGGCPPVPAPLPLCGYYPEVVFNNVPLVTGASGTLSPEVRPRDATWYTAWVSLAVSVDRPDLISAGGEPSTCEAVGGVVVPLLSGTYHVVQGGTYGEEVVVEVRDVVVDAPEGHDIRIDLARWRLRLSDPPQRIP